MGNNIKLDWNHIKSLAKATAAAGIGFLIATAANYNNYSSYWNKTIFNVQTVDFNMLSHMLPTKLSYALIRGNEETIQNTINSNYALFGIVVTDCRRDQRLCPDQNILYGSQGRVDYKEIAQEIDLSNHSYDLLRNPPPLLAEGEYIEPREPDRVDTNATNTGEIIGRVYYLRGTPPSFFSDYTRWLKNPIKSSGANRLYFLTTLLFMLSGLFVYYFIERKRIIYKNRYLETENRLIRTRNFIGGIQEVIERDFSSVISNQIQELEMIFRRLNIDIDNIAHDLRKAPLIGYPENTPGETLEKLSLQPLSELEKDEVIKGIAKYLEKADKTIRLIKWVVEDLNEIANLESVPVHIQEQVKLFLDNLPPNLLHKSWLTIKFQDLSDQPLWIKCNGWHLRSIIKNVLYNSSAILMDVYEDHDFEFEGEITISSVRSGNEAGILIEDNGPGFSEQALERLYQDSQKVNATASSARGRGSIIVFSYLSLHGGRVELSNKPEGGAKALFLFPLVCNTEN